MEPAATPPAVKTKVSADAAALYAELGRTFPMRRAREVGVDGLRVLGQSLEGANDAAPEVHSVTEHAAPGPAGPVGVRLYRPTQAGRLPVLIWIHGGGWTLGGLDSTDTHARALTVAAGCAVLSVDHRHAPEHPYPAAVQDACSAVRWAVRTGEDLGLDTERFVLGGISSGGNVAAAVCLTLRGEGHRLPLMQLLVAPAVDLSPDTPSMLADGDPSLAAADVAWFWSLYHGGDPRRAPATAMPVNSTSLAGLPPALVLVGAVDPLADGASHYAQRLRADGTPAETIVYDGAGHALLAMPFEAGRRSVQDAATGLSRAFQTDLE